MDEDGYRYLSFGCYLHRLFFIGIACLAIFSHFKAMTTDPGAVPPDAHPLPEKEDEKQKGDWEYEELDNLIKGEALHLNHHHHHPHHPNLPQQQQLYSQQQHHASIAGTTVSNNHLEEGLAGRDGNRSDVANNRMEQFSTSSSSLMQDGPDPLEDTPNDSKWNKIGLPQAARTTVTAVAVAAIATGGIAMAGVKAMASSGTESAMNVDDGTTGRESDGVAIGGLARSGGGGTVEERPIGHGEKKNIQSPSSLHQRGRRMCRRCHAFKPPRAHHCRYG